MLHEEKAVLLVLRILNYSPEHMLLVKKNKQQHVSLFQKIKTEISNFLAVTDNSVSTMLIFVMHSQLSTPLRTPARMWSAVGIRCALLRATRGPHASIARNWSRGRKGFDPWIRMCLGLCLVKMMHNLSGQAVHCQSIGPLLVHPPHHNNYKLQCVFLGSYVTDQNNIYTPFYSTMYIYCCFFGGQLQKTAECLWCLFKRGWNCRNVFPVRGKKGKASETVIF